MTATNTIAEDKLLVTETTYRYATGIDTRNWELYRSIFADEVSIDFSSYNPARPASTMAADQWVAGLRPLFTGLAATQHSMTNPLVSLDGDRAEITMYMQAHHVHDAENPDSWYTIGGYYTDTLKRSDGGWLIDSVALTVTWRSGDPAIMEAARVDGVRLLKTAPLT